MTGCGALKHINNARPQTDVRGTALCGIQGVASVSHTFYDTPHALRKRQVHAAAPHPRRPCAAALSLATIMGRRSQNGGRRAAGDGNRGPRRNTRAFNGRNRVRRRGGAAGGGAYGGGGPATGAYDAGVTSTTRDGGPISDWPTLAQQAAHPQRRGVAHTHSASGAHDGHAGRRTVHGMPAPQPHNSSGARVGAAGGGVWAGSDGRGSSGGAGAARSSGGRAVSAARHEQCSRQLVAALDRLCPLEPAAVRGFRDAVLGEVQALLVQWVRRVSQQDAATAALASMEPMAAARLCVSGSYVMACAARGRVTKPGVT